ncbi:phage portal protein [Corynebacterium propinquum]|uniref:Phage portal protein n=1 Tax=Corynebacterium propinquum TaxID=43769 RepID=A0AAP4BTF9_9CORY|nr:phage portal protein [Corynebacterium propinquum]DAY26828.1 MAG TPA: PORTAL PROTEIN [Caudoviricetes sp.]MDK4235746.1 phage portal protein [Corynebacterium propinquum]MDK4252758.1 phage portal protein [Corynebacterium propinquum]MDK4282918.1 phage portal protein [Corynebacterium propinquum]MDK4326120.1 phage portal protein [Corynebacterium propinquum]
MRRDKVEFAVRELLSTHVAERRVFDNIHEYMVPWDNDMAVARVGASLNSKNRGQHAELARMSVAPFVALVVDTYSQSLKVDGFYSSDGEQADAWSWWQRNKMSARQTGLHRAALTYGTSYASVLPAAGDALRIGVHSPRRMVTFYSDSLGLPGRPSSDEYPMLALEIGDRHLRMFDEENVYWFGVEKAPRNVGDWLDRTYISSSNLVFQEARPHNMGAVPVVRYRDRMLTDGEERRGIVEHLLGLQDRINRTNYEQGVAQHFAAFKQRYVIGWMPENEMQAFRQSVADTQFFDDPDVKVGQYDETDLSRYINSRQASVRDFAALAQVPAQSLGANAISNISADGLAALETSKDRQAAEIQTSLGESHEQLLRLCSHAVGDDDGANDFDAEVTWEETSSRSFAQTVDGLGKLTTMLGIPPEELWSDIPGWTKERVERARSTARASSLFSGIADADGSVGGLQL